MRKALVFFSCLLLCGCLQSKEHLSFTKDGSGTLEVHLMVPEGTLTMIDSTMGAMVKGMAQAFGAGGKDMPPSVAEEMFSSQDEMFKKAKKVGLNITFKSYAKEIKDKNLYVDYTIGFDDVNKLLQSGLLMTHLALAKNDQGQIVAVLKKDKKKAEESKGQVAAGAEGGEAPQQGQKPETPQEKEMKEKFMKALSQFEIEFRLTMPTPVENVTGMFVKDGADTVSFSLKGDIFKDKTLIDKFYGAGDQETQAVASGEGIAFALPTLAEAMAEVPSEDISSAGSSSAVAAQGAEGGNLSLGQVLEKTEPPAQENKGRIKQFPSGTRVKVTMKDGEIIEGKLVEQTKEYVRVDSVGLPMTYFTELIWKLDEAGSDDAQKSQ
ncbi:MAG: hypothetical protein WC409_02530 [Candidatus Omnitrophota bacterium]